MMFVNTLGALWEGRCHILIFHCENLEILTDAHILQ